MNAFKLVPNGELDEQFGALMSTWEWLFVAVVIKDLCCTFPLILASFEP